MAPKTKKAKDSRTGDLCRLGVHIREDRNHSNLTQAALAEGLGISVAYVSLIERAGRNSQNTTMVAIARALGVSAAKLVE